MQQSAYLQFSHLVKVDGRYREFNFLRKKSGDKTVFNVDVADERGNRYYFDMLEFDSKWNISGHPVPEWISKAETDLQSVISEREKESKDG